jgi:hypothetical protein
MNNKNIAKENCLNKTRTFSKTQKKGKKQVVSVFYKHSIFWYSLYKENQNKT